MIVTLDGERLEGSWEAAGSLGDIVERVRRDHLSDRVIVEVSLNGENLVNESLNEQFRKALMDADQVDLVSAAPHGLAVEALRAAAVRLADAAGAHKLVAQMLQSGNMVNAVNSFGGLLSVWQDCQRIIVDTGGLVGEDVTVRVVQGKAIREHFSGLAHQLRDVRDAFDARDYVLLADLLEFELPDVCRRWNELFGALADQFDADCSTTSARCVGEAVAT